MRTTKNNTAKAFRQYLTANGYYRDRQLTGQANNRGQNITFNDLVHICQKGDIVGRGATKACYTPTDRIAVVFIRPDGWERNQIKEQYDTWERMTNDQRFYFNPIQRACFLQGDKKQPEDTQYLQNTALISQKAIVRDYGTLLDLILLAQSMNISKGFRMEDGRTLTAEQYCREYAAVMQQLQLTDILHHIDNNGIIFDYYTNQYRVVAIDYAI